MKRKLNRFAERAVPLAIMVGAVACSPLTGSAPDFDVRPVASGPTTDASADQGYYPNAVAAIEKRDYGLALNFLQAARASEPNSARVLNAFGVVYDKLGRFDLSARYYAQAQNADPQSLVVARNIAYSHVLQRLLNGDVTPSQLAAAGPAPKPPVVIETQTVIAPEIATAATPSASPAPQATADASSPGRAVSEVQPGAPAEAKDLNAQISDPHVDRPILAADIEVPSSRPQNLVATLPHVDDPRQPSVQKFVLTARNDSLLGNFLFPSQSLQVPDLATQTPDIGIPRQVTALQLSPSGDVPPRLASNLPQIEVANDSAISDSPPALRASEPVLPNENTPQIAQPLAPIEFAREWASAQPVQKLTVAQLVVSNESVLNLQPQTSALAALDAQSASVSLSQDSVSVAASPVRSSNPGHAVAQRQSDRPAVRAHAAITHAAVVKLATAARAAIPVANAAPAHRAPAKQATLPKTQQFAMWRPAAHTGGHVAGLAAKPALLTHHPLVIVNASAQKDGDDSIRRVLIRRNWTVAQAHVVFQHKEPYTTLFYERADYAVARGLARTLDLPMHLVPDACHCVGLRLVIGTNALNRRYSELESAAPQRMISTASASWDMGSIGLQQW